MGGAPPTDGTFTGIIPEGTPPPWLVPPSRIFSSGVSCQGFGSVRPPSSRKLTSFLAALEAASSCSTGQPCGSIASAPSSPRPSRAMPCTHTTGGHLPSTSCKCCHQDSVSCGTPSKHSSKKCCPAIGETWIHRGLSTCVIPGGFRQARIRSTVHPPL